MNQNLAATPNKHEPQYGLQLPFTLETELEQMIAAVPAWQTGVLWGQPRPGHPEGQVLAHIGDMLDNIERYCAASPERERLRLLALLHDTFKYQRTDSLADPLRPSHGHLARRFAEEYITDAGILCVLEHHDDAYKAYRHGQRSGDWQTAEQMALALIQKLGEHLPLFLCFYWCDNHTPGKSRAHYAWFRSLVTGSSDEGGIKCACCPAP